MDDPKVIALVVGLAAAVIFFIIGYFIGYIARKRSAEKAIGSAEAEAGR